MHPTNNWSASSRLRRSSDHGSTPCFSSLWLTVLGHKRLRIYELATSTSGTSKFTSLD